MSDAQSVIWNLDQPVGAEQDEAVIVQREAARLDRLIREFRAAGPAASEEEEGA